MILAKKSVSRVTKMTAIVCSGCLGLLVILFILVPLPITLQFTTHDKHNCVRHHVLIPGIKKPAWGLTCRAMASDLDGRYNEACKDYQSSINAFDFKNLAPNKYFEIVRIAYYRNRGCNDYFTAMSSSESLSRWHKNTIRLFIPSGKNGFTAAVHKVILDALKEWCNVLTKPISVVEVMSAEDSDISVIPMLSGIFPVFTQGETAYFDHAEDQYELFAEARKRQVAVENIDWSRCSEESRSRFRGTCLHEMGHALGLGGHSIFADDVMFFSTGTENNRLTPRDVSAMRQLYQDNSVDNVRSILDQADQNNDPYALTRTGQDYQMCGKFKQALSCYKTASALGLAEAQKCLGKMYEHGWGVSKDERQAVMLYWKAAEQELPEGLALLGHCYEKGIGTAPNINEATKLYEQSEEAGCSKALTLLGSLYEKGLGISQNYKRAIELYQQASTRGQPDAEVYLAKCYELGDGVSQDFKAAFELYSRAAQQGNAAGMRALARMYEKGLGVKKDPKKAIELYRSAAKLIDK